MSTNVQAGAPEMGSAFNLLSKSADLVKKYWKLFLTVNLFTILFSLGNISGSEEPTNSQGTPLWVEDLKNMSGGEWAMVAVIAVAIIVLSMFFYAMMVSLSVKATQGNVKGFSDLVEDGKKYFFPLLGQIILMGFIIVIGLLLFIIPGIFAVQRLLMAPFILVSEDLGVVDSLKRSRQLAKSNSNAVWSVLGVSIVVAILCGVLGFIPYLGVVASIVLSIAWSLIVPLRYSQIKNLKPASA